MRKVAENKEKKKLNLFMVKGKVGMMRGNEFQSLSGN
jgi:hypothetical protein